MERDAYVDNYFEDTTNSETTLETSNSETTTVWDEWRPKDVKKKTPSSNSWAKKLVDTTFKSPWGRHRVLKRTMRVILPLMSFANSVGDPTSSNHEQLERMNALLKTTLQNVNKNAVQFEQKSKEWERLYFTKLAENERLLSENCSIAAELEAAKKKLGAIQDFFLTKSFKCLYIYTNLYIYIQTRTKKNGQFINDEWSQIK